MNKEQVVRVLKDYDNLVEYFYRFLPKYYSGWDIYEIEIYKEQIQLHLKYDSSCGVDYDYCYIPLSLVHDVDEYYRWLEDERIRKLELERQKKLEESERIEKTRKEKEYQTYLQLKKKFNE